MADLHRQHVTDALRIVEREQIDVLVTNILMPGRDGIELVMLMRARFPRVKVVVLSGGGKQVGLEPLTYAGQLGAHAALVKPFEFELPS